MNVAIIGYGKMGKEIEHMLESRSHKVLAFIDCEDDWSRQKDLVCQCHIAIEFSIPAMVVRNILKCFEMGLPVVVGTTGWYDRLPEIKEICIKQNKSIFTASNFSIGVNLFFELNRYLAKLMSNYREYEVEMTEIHHAQKLDAPSGTALTLANDIIHALEKKQIWASQSAKSEEELLITSVREGSIPGTHIVTYFSDIESIEIKHEAKSRKGFALGAVLAAEFLIGKTGYYEMKDLLASKIN